MTLCDPCQVLYDGWITYKNPARGYVTLNNPERSLEAYKAHTAATRALIKRQTDMVVDSCRRKHQEPAVA